MNAKYIHAYQKLKCAISHEDYSDILKEMISISPLGYFQILKKKDFKKLYDEVVRFTPLLNDKKYSITTKCYWYINNIIDFPKCKHCEKPFIDNVRSTIGYPQWCSSACKNADPTFIETCRKSRYAKNNGKWHSIDYPEKVKQGNIRNGHDPNWRNGEKIKATKLANHGSASYVNPDKAKQTRYKQNNGHFCSEHEIKLRKLHNKSKISYKKGQDTYFKRTGYRNPGQNPEAMRKAKAPYLYDSQYFRSSWELAKYIYHKDMHDIFEYQPNITFKYYDSLGKEHIYCPDFIVNGQLQEVKGDQFFRNGKMILPYRYKSWTDEYYQYKCDQYNAKFQCMILNNVQILKSQDIQKYLDYVNLTYGNTYIRQFKQIR